jgi:hypothetical protein
VLIPKTIVTKKKKQINGMFSSSTHLDKMDVWDLRMGLRRSDKFACA